MADTVAKVAPEAGYDLARLGVSGVEIGFCRDSSFSWQIDLCCTRCFGHLAGCLVLSQCIHKIIDTKRSKMSSAELSNVYAHRGFSYVKLGQNGKGIADYKKALKLKPNDAITYNYRGWAYKNKLEYDKAAADYKKAIEIDPHYADAKKNLQDLAR